MYTYTVRRLATTSSYTRQQDFCPRVYVFIFSDTRTECIVIICVYYINTISLSCLRVCVCVCFELRVRDDIINKYIILCNRKRVGRGCSAYPLYGIHRILDTRANIWSILYSYTHARVRGA